MFMEVKKYNNGQFQQNKSKPKKQGIKRFFRPLLAILRRKGSKKLITDIPNNLKDITIDDYATVIRKAANDESFLRSYYEIDPFCDQDHQEDIKTDEFNEFAWCQHENHNFIVPINYIRTDAGTFFWASVQSRFDDDLLNPLWCSTSNQMAQMQWNIAKTSC